MKSTENFLKCLSVVVALAAVLHFNAGSSAAALLVPSTSIIATAEADPTGPALVSSTVPIIPLDPTKFTGSLTSSVYTDPTNPLGGLTFAYQFSNDATSINALARLTVTGFANWLTDASYKFSAGTVAPGLVDRSVAPGDVIGFSFLKLVLPSPLPTIGFGTIPPGKTSSLLVVQTNAHDYGKGTASVIDGSVATVAAFAPTPEPATIVVWLGLGALGCIGYARQRKNVACASAVVA